MKTILKNVYPELELDTNIAIIGSSANLLEHELGGHIDGFAEVIRFNRAPTQNFEKYVGSKTTLRVTNNHVFNNTPHTVELADDNMTWKAEGQPTNFILNQRNQRIMLLNRDSAPWEEKDKQIDESCEAFLGDYAKIDGYDGLCKPSAGLAFLILCLQNNIKPTLFGFGIEEAEHQASHYWEEKGEILVSHSYKGERQRLKKWTTEGLLVIK